MSYKILLRIIIPLLLLTSFCSGFFSVKNIVFDEDSSEEIPSSKEKYSFKRTHDYKTVQKMNLLTDFEASKQEWLDKIRPEITEEEIRLIWNEWESADVGFFYNIEYDMLMKISGDHPELALELVIKYYQKVFRHYYGLPDAMKNWIQKNPGKALEFYERHKAEDWMHRELHHKDFFLFLAKGLAKENTDTAGKWMAELSPGLALQAREGLIEAMIEDNPGELVNYLSQEDIRKFPRSDFDNLIGKWIKADTDAAKSWIDGLPDKERRRFLPDLYYHLCQQSGGDADLLFQSVTQEDKPALAKAIGKYLLENKPYPEVGEWIVKQEDKQNLRSEIGHLVDRWGSTDTAGVRGWILEMEDPSTRDFAIKEYATERFAELEPRITAELIEKMSESEGRLPVIKKFVGQWSQKDSRSVLEWINTANITEKEKSELRAHLNQG